MAKSRKDKSKRPQGDPKPAAEADETESASSPAPAAASADTEEPGEPETSEPGHADAGERKAGNEPPPGPKGRSRLWLLGVLAAVVAVLFGLNFLRGASKRILFAQDVQVVSVTLPHEVVPGGSLPLTFRFKPEHPLDADDWVFVHVENDSGQTNPCRMVQDLLPSTPPTKWGTDEVEHSVTIPVASSCVPGRFEIYAGLYNRQTQARLKLVDPKVPDNRLHVGSIDIVAEDADGSLRTLKPKDMRAEDDWVLIRPWAPWLLAIGVTGALAAVLFIRRRGKAEDDESEDHTLSREVRLLSYLVVAVPFFLGVLVVLEFIKDDAYISFRYAHNLVTGKGLVFNSGEYLEGYTNFLWVLLMAPFEKLGWDLFQVCEVIGTILGIACLVVVARFTSWINGEKKLLSHLWGAAFLATAPSFVLWVKSGLEQPFVCLFPILGAFLLWRARDRFLHDPPAAGSLEFKKLQKRYLYCGLLMGAACMTRPELHMAAALVGLPLVLDAVRARKITLAQLLYVAGILIVIVPCHTFRYFYYGTLIPNTFYVKTGTGSLIWRTGLKTLREMFSFNNTGILAVLAPLAFADRRRTVEKGAMAIISVAYMVFYVKVGVDEMQWHRLYLPALPFLCVLAALGAQNLLNGVFGGSKSKGLPGLVPAAVGWVAVIVAGASNFNFTYHEFHGFDGHGDLAGTFHPDLGKFIVRHERPGALVAFQDMGSTPYHAPDINFLDFFGLTDKTVAHARHDYGLHAFVGEDESNNRPKYEAEMRDYFFKRAPEWCIFTIYTPEADIKHLQKVFNDDPTGGSFGNAFDYNSVQFALWDDPRFRERYVPVRTWPRSVSYYLALFRRKDLWEQTPREVVLDALPAGTAGVTASFEGGLELLGSDMTKETLERHEAFITTWWKLPGPMPKDLYFFVHISKTGFQAPGDHVPGDWMYPADRWQAGQILEDRTLFQLPPFVMPPGKYSVYIGAYQKSTGKRLKVLRGSKDNDDRVYLGDFVAKPLYPLIEQLIPPTRVDVMRKYPDRIIDSHRAPGT